MQIIYTLIIVLLLGGCTTTRPLTPTEVRQQRIQDTLRLKTMVVNNPVQTKTIRDTSERVIKELTREVVNTIEEKLSAILTPLKAQLSPDTAQLASLMERYYQQGAAEREMIKASMASLERLVLASKVRAVDSVRTLMQDKIETTRQQAQQVIEAGNKVVYGLSNIWLVLSVVTIVVYLGFRYLKSRLKKKEFENNKTPARA